LFLIMKVNYKNQYNDMDRKMELNEMRSHLEQQIYELNHKLTSSQDKWSDVNHLLISSQKVTENVDFKNNKGEFLTYFGIDKNLIKMQNDYIFVLMPFNNMFSEHYETIKNSCNQIGFQCSRGDEKYIDGDVLPNILKEILKARIVITIIDGRNPNVYYELGIAHALNKQTILVSNNMDDIPFDLKTKNILIYSNQDELQSRVKNSLSRLLIDGIN
jgi:hypothetical protein